MNLCSICHYEDGKLKDGRYIVNGTSLCNNHAHIAMENKPTSDASKSTLKWESDTVEE